MPFTSARTGFCLAAPVAVLVVVSSCSLPPVPQSSLVPRPSGVLSEASIANADGSTAYDVVARLRPSVVAATSGQLFAPTVYLDGLRLCGISEMQMIPAAGLVQVRFLSATEAYSLYGSQAGRGGAIVLTTKRGRPKQ